MQLFVKWDYTNAKILKGPQAVRPVGDDWVPFILRAEIVDPRSQKLTLRFDHQLGAVVQDVEGLPQIDYKRARGAMYPNIREQLDALWHDIDAGTLDKTGRFYALIAEVKNSVPRT